MFLGQQERVGSERMLELRFVKRCNHAPWPVIYPS